MTVKDQILQYLSECDTPQNYYQLLGAIQAGDATVSERVTELLEAGKIKTVTHNKLVCLTIS